MSEKYGQSTEGLRAKLTSVWARTSAMTNAVQRSFRNAKTELATAWKQGGGTEPVVLSLGSPNSGVHSVEVGQARDFNREMARRGWVGRTDGGSGVGAAASEGMSEGRGRMAGVNSMLPREQAGGGSVASGPSAAAENVQGIAVFRGGVETIGRIGGILADINSGRMSPTPVAFVDSEYWRPLRGQLLTAIEQDKSGPEILDPKNIRFTDDALAAADFVEGRAAELRGEARQASDTARQRRAQRAYQTVAAIPGLGSLLSLAARKAKPVHVDASSSATAGAGLTRSRSGPEQSRGKAEEH